MKQRGFASAADCVSLWERGVRLRPIDRGLLLVAQAYPQIDPACLADISVGFINRALLQLRVALFGSHLDATMQCPECSGKLDLALELAPLLAQLQAERNLLFTPILELQGQRYRPPTSRDLASVSHASQSASQGAPGLALLNRCCIDGGASNNDTQAQLEQVADGLEQLDPALDIRFDLMCDHCNQPVQFGFDVGEYLWLEFETWVRQLLEQVHLLASTYSWSEQAILGMTQQRRNYYVMRVQG